MIIGVVGKPNVGKSTFFKATTLANVEIADYPFATIKPNSGVGYVRVKDVAEEFGKESNPRDGYCMNGTRFVPVQLIDVAGLVPGAYEGKGMGNQFLDDLRQADVLIHVIDVSGGTNEKGESVESGSNNPADDIKFLEFELDMWYLGIIKKGWEKFARTIMQEKKDVHKALGNQLSGVKVTEDMIEDAIKEIGLNKEKPKDWSEKEMMQLATFLRKKTKPMIIACNKIDIKEGKENFIRLKKEFPDHMLIECSSESELALREASKHELIEYVPGDSDFSIVKDQESKLSDNQKKALGFIKENILKPYNSTGVQEVLDNSVFKLLKYIAIFPGGVKTLEDQHGNTLPDCFLMPPKTTALDFAYRLHTDFGKNFIKAIDVRSKRVIGKDHPLIHLDIMEIAAGK